MAEARCYQTNAYKGGALTLWVDGLTVSHVNIWRTDRYGTNAMMIRGGYDIEVKSGRVIVADPEVPFNDTVIYKVVEKLSDPTLPSPTLAQTSGCQVSDLSLHPEDTTMCSPIYLCDPLTPELGDWFGLLSIDPLSYPARTQLYDILARHAPVAVSQLRSTARTTMRYITRTLEERYDFLSMMQSGRILLYRNPDPSYPEDNWYISVGEITEERISPDHRDPHRRWVVEIAVVDRPVGKLAGGINANRDYETYRDFEPDGIRTITPPFYGSPGVDGAYADYTDYVHVLIGGASAITGTGATGTGGTYGNSRYPTVQAAKTSWSIV